jgi:hypothetical protein
MIQRVIVLALSLVTGLAVSGFSRPLQGADQPGEWLQWLWVLLILVIAVVVAIAIWWWLRAPGQRKEAPSVEPKPAVADDLTRVEGIGPKIAGLLQEAGISTFAQLAGTTVERLGQIMAQAGLAALADPSTWPEQARLAAEGQWDRLDTLQDELKGGRRA